MKIEYRRGFDWAEFYVDGKLVRQGHSIPDFVFVEALRAAGAEVAEPQGSFCFNCTEWVPGLTVEVCGPCRSRPDDM